MVTESADAAAGGADDRAQAGIHTFSKVLYIVTLCRKYTRALTFENLWKERALSAALARQLGDSNNNLDYMSRLKALTHSHTSPLYRDFT